MEGFGELFGGIGEFFGGLSEAAEGGVEIAAAAAASGRGGAGEEAPVHERYLAGARRVLNINDL